MRSATALSAVLIVQSWLIGVGWVLYGAQLFGRWTHDSWLQGWAESRSGAGKPAAGETGKPAAGDKGG